LDCGILPPLSLPCTDPSTARVKFPSVDNSGHCGLGSSHDATHSSSSHRGNSPERGEFHGRAHGSEPLQ
jgi:hypothetical protein